MQVVILPVKARTRLVDALAASLRQITEMEKCLALGIEGEVNLDLYSPLVFKHFERASGKAKNALSAAETFRKCSQLYLAVNLAHTKSTILQQRAQDQRLVQRLGFDIWRGSSNRPSSCRADLPRSFSSFTKSLTEWTICSSSGPLTALDRLSTTMFVRFLALVTNRTGLLTEPKAQTFPYRRNLAAAVNIVLFAVQEALTTKLALPQFLPSARVANLRLTNRVRQVARDDLRALVSHAGDQETTLAHRRAAQPKYIPWNATAAAQAEIVEYLEELVDLTKLLVGANEFRSGMLTRPTYLEYVEKIGRQNGEGDVGHVKGENPESVEGLKKRRSETMGATAVAVAKTTSSKLRITESEDLPNSLERIRSRRQDIRVRSAEPRRT